MSGTDQFFYFYFPLHRLCSETEWCFVKCSCRGWMARRSTSSGFHILWVEGVVLFEFRFCIFKLLLKLIALGINVSIFRLFAVDLQPLSTLS